MWATVGAALKKIAVALLGNPKVLKTIGGIVLGLIIIIVMPVVAIVSIFNGDIEIDTNELQRMVVENLSAEEQAKLQFVEDTMYAIEREMKASGFSDPRVTEAQVLFTLSLYDYAQEADFVSKLVGCFASEQTDEQLIAAVNAAFGTAISAEEFSQVMGAIRSVYIDTSGYIDPCTKNNLDLVEWAKQAKLRGWGYVWGTYGEVLTRSYYNAKAEQYPDEVGGYADFIESNWLGGRTSDCNGLIKGYALASLYRRGQGVEQDNAEAFRLYTMAASDENSPNAYAAYELGRMYKDGVGTTADKAASESWYRKAYLGFLSIERQMADDMLSFISLHKEGWRQHSYAASCGVSDLVMRQMLKDNPQIDTVFLCRDNDERGQTANQRTAEALFEKGIQHKILIPIRKDWNEDLIDQAEETEEEVCVQPQL